MDEFPIGGIGTGGWLLVIIVNMLRACTRSEAFTALLPTFIGFIFTIEVWAIGPDQLQDAYPNSLWPFYVIYAAAIAPYVFLFIRLAFMHINEKPLDKAPSTPFKDDRDNAHPQENPQYQHPPSVQHLVPRIRNYQQPSFP